MRIICPTCKGTKRLAHYAHINNGVCYMCSGSGKVDETVIPTLKRQVEDNTRYAMDFNNLFTIDEMNANAEWAQRQFMNGMSIDDIREKIRLSICRRIDQRAAARQ